MAAACRGVDSQDLATILDPFQAIFTDLGSGRLSQQQTSFLLQEQTSVLSQQMTADCLGVILAWDGRKIFRPLFFT